MPWHGRRVKKTTPPSPPRLPLARRRRHRAAAGERARWPREKTRKRGLALPLNIPGVGNFAAFCVIIAPADCPVGPIATNSQGRKCHGGYSGDGFFGWRFCHWPAWRWAGSPLRRCNRGRAPMPGPTQGPHGWPKPAPNRRLPPPRSWPWCKPPRRNGWSGWFTRGGLADGPRRRRRPPRPAEISIAPRAPDAEDAPAPPIRRATATQGRPNRRGGAGRAWRS